MKKLEDNLSPFLKKKRTLNWRRGSWGKSYYLSVFSGFTDLDIFLNTILLLTKIERTVIWFHTFPSNIGVTPILLSRYAHFFYYCGSWYWGIPVFTYFIFPGLILCLPSKCQDLNKCSLSEYNSFYDHPFKSLLLIQ